MLLDVAADGATLLWPHPLGPGVELALSAACGRDDSAVVVSVTRAAGRAPHGRFYVHRCRFVGDDAGFQAFDRRVANLQLAQSRAAAPSTPAGGWLLRRRSRRAARYSISLPVRFTTASQATVTVTRDLSATGLSVLTGHLATIGERLALEIAAPQQRWTGQVTVARCELLADGVEGPVYLWGLRFDGLDTQRDISRFRRWISA